MSDQLADVIPIQPPIVCPCCGGPLEPVFTTPLHEAGTYVLAVSVRCPEGCF